MNPEGRLLCVTFYIVVLAFALLKHGIEASDFIEISLAASSLVVFLMLFKLYRDIEPHR